MRKRRRRQRRRRRRRRRRRWRRRRRSSRLTVWAAHCPRAHWPEGGLRLGQVGGKQRGILLTASSSTAHPAEAAAAAGAGEGAALVSTSNHPQSRLALHLPDSMLSTAAVLTSCWQLCHFCISIDFYWNVMCWHMSNTINVLWCEYDEHVWKFT